jgi:ParB family chromosome partitioning protein
MGGIDIDPCSCPAANGVVKAATFYDEADNGLARQWIGRVFVNPPYGDGTVDSFASKLLAELSAGHASQAVFLVNNCTETKWFQGLITQADAVCFPQGRISFWSLEKKSKSPLQGQAVIYFGSNAKRFKRAFSRIGFCTLIR